MANEVIVFPFEEEARQSRRVFEDGVARWAASDIARWAGAARPNMVKSIVDDHIEEFEAFGGLLAAPANPGPQGGRPGEEYWLAFEHSLLLCVFLRSPRAADVRHVLIRVTSDLVKGNIPPAINDAQSVLVTLTDIQRQNTALLVKMDERLDRIDSRQERVEVDLSALRSQSSIIYMTALEGLALARETAARLPAPRRGATLSTEATCQEVNLRMFDGGCPRCHEPILERKKDGTVRRLPNATMHHHFGRERRHPTEMCCICASCNQAVEDPNERILFGPTFNAIVIVTLALLNKRQLELALEPAS